MNSLLSVISWFYRLGPKVMRFLIRNHIKKQETVQIPVISIGNITFGGSEKTPLAIELIKFLLKNSQKPAFVSRGYKGEWEKKGGDLHPQDRPSPGWRALGDEPYMAYKNASQAGIFVGKNRIQSCRLAHRKGYDVAVLDDGFQYYSLKKDLEIVLHNPGKKTPLRESVSSLKRAHMILVKKSGPAFGQTSLSTQFPQTQVYEYSVVPKEIIKMETGHPSPPDPFRSNKVLAFCGIANPQRFIQTLLKNKIRPAGFLKFPDHYEYPQKALHQIRDKHRSLNSDVIITTEKDAVKLEGRSLISSWPLYYQKIALDLDNDFYEQVLSILNRLKK
ncbi:MAG: tetraacyldisaccharide 4'-kinase [Candidatus Aminicenantes bacterium]|nr:tetraacyldisaccharide 4'-kinase [Candidatus Aminicenantes bacterium]